VLCSASAPVRPSGIGDWSRMLSRKVDTHRT
jgi:hypothetical protein